MSKILIVDDEKNICELINLYLVKEGFETDLAHTGKEAVTKFQADTYDLVLLDIMLPEMDGWEVCREIRRYSDIPIVMLTARSDESISPIGVSKILPSATIPSLSRQQGITVPSESTPKWSASP